MPSHNTFEDFATDDRLFAIASQGSADQLMAIADDARLLLDRMNAIPTSDRLRLYYAARESLLATIRQTADAAQQLEVSA